MGNVNCHILYTKLPLLYHGKKDIMGGQTVASKQDMRFSDCMTASFNRSEVFVGSGPNRHGASIKMLPTGASTAG